MHKICASVVLFHPNINELKDNINTYIHFVDTLYLIDNTPTSDEKYSELTLFSPKIKIISNQANLGIAKALNIALINAQQNNFSWLLTMDQDSSFYDFGFFISCFHEIDNKKDIAVLSPNIDYKENKHLCHKEEKNKLITSGSIVNVTLSQKIGYYNEDLFIDEVDFEYCLKAKTLGYKIIMFTHIPLNHFVGVEKKIRNKNIIEHNAARVYYMTRNRLYMASKFRKSFPKEYSYRKIINQAIFKKLKYIIKYEENKLQKIKSLYLGIKHFIQNRYGVL